MVNQYVPFAEIATDFLVDEKLPIAVWGFGFYARNCLEFLSGEKRLKVELIVDGNLAGSTTTSFKGIPVVNPKQFWSIARRYFVLLCMRPGNGFDPSVLKEYSVPHAYFDHLYLTSNIKSIEQSKRLFTEHISDLTFCYLIGARFSMQPIVGSDVIFDRQYFALPKFKRSRNQVFIDCGAFVGDTFETWFIQNEGSIGAYIGFEPLRHHVELFSNRVKRLKAEYPLDFDKFFLRECFVSNKRIASQSQPHSRDSDHKDGPDFSTSRGGHNGSQSSMLDVFNENEHEVSTIDHEVSAIRTVVEKANSALIKMDLEGGELSALEGAVETIDRYRPLLAISVYHRIDHLIRIPIWISRNFAGYRFHLRHHSPSLDETVLYCEPSEH